MSIDRFIKKDSFTAKTSPDSDSEISLPQDYSPTSEDFLVYIFEGDHQQDLELLSSKDDADGLQVKAGYSGSLPPFRAKADDRPRFLKVNGSNETVTVRLIETDTEFFGGLAGATNNTHDKDSSGTQTTTSSYANACALSRSDGDHWTEAHPWSNNLGNSSNDHQWRLLKANRTGLDPANAPTADDITGNADWETVDSGTVTQSDYEPKLSGAGYEVFADTLVLQIRDDGAGNTEDTENELTADRDK